LSSSSMRTLSFRGRSGKCCLAGRCVQGPFEVQRRDGPALIVVNLVDDLTYRERSNLGTSVFRQMPRRSFLVTRLVPVGEEWMLSGPTSVLRPAEREVA
jgi:hypothetical protein